MLIKLIAASYIQSAIALLTGLVNIKYLSPADIGHYSGTLLWKDFALHCNSGENESLRKLLPSTKNAEQQQDFFDRAFTLAILTVVSYSAIAILLHFFRHESNKFDLTRVAVLLVFVIEYIQYSFQATLMGTNRFSLISRFVLVTSLFNLSTCIFVYSYGLHGFLVGRVLYAFSSLIIMMLLVGIRPTKFVFQGYFEILKTGLPMQATVICTLLNSNAGRIFLTLQGDNKNLGLLVFCLYFTVPFSQIVINIAGLSFFKYSSVNNRSVMKSGLDVKGNWLFTTLLILLATSAVGLFIKLVFSEYSQIILPTQILILTTITAMMYSDRVSYILANAGGVSLAIFNLVAAMMFFFVTLILTQSGIDPLLSISISSLVSAHMLGIFVLFWLELRESHQTKAVIRLVLKEWLKIVHPMLISGLILFSGIKLFSF